jgi:hypothetical protein
MKEESEELVSGKQRTTDPNNKQINPNAKKLKKSRKFLRDIES